jgi:hypothetical protein
MHKTGAWKLCHLSNRGYLISSWIIHEYIRQSFTGIIIWSPQLQKTSNPTTIEPSSTESGTNNHTEAVPKHNILEAGIWKLKCIASFTQNTVNATCAFHFSADLNVVLGFINTTYEASETDMDVIVQIGLLNGLLRKEVALELTVLDLSRFSCRVRCKLPHAHTIFRLWRMHF